MKVKRSETDVCRIKQRGIEADWRKNDGKGKKLSHLIDLREGSAPSTPSLIRKYNIKGGIEIKIKCGRYWFNLWPTQNY